MTKTQINNLYNLISYSVLTKGFMDLGCQFMFIFVYFQNHSLICTLVSKYIDKLLSFIHNMFVKSRHKCIIYVYLFMFMYVHQGGYKIDGVDT